MDINNVLNSKLNNLASTRLTAVKNQPNYRNESGRDIPENDIKLNKENVENLVDTLNSAAKSINKRISFAYHEKTNRVIMKVQDAVTEEVIREIPPKEMIRLLEGIREMIGTFVDESR